MKSERALIFIKFLHTIVWIVMASATIYIFYAGITKTFTIWLWVSIVLMTLESLVLMINKWTCPLTPLAMKYTENRNDNFDIYLPRVIAKYNKIIFGTIFVVGIILVIFNSLNSYL